MHKLLFDLSNIITVFQKELNYLLAIVFIYAATASASLILISQIYSVKYQGVPKVVPGQMISLHSGEADRTLKRYMAEYIAKDNSLFVHTTFYSTYLFSLDLPNGSHRKLGRKVTPSFFEIFGSSTRLGRTILESDVTYGAEQVVVISFELWKGHFLENPNIIGDTIKIDEQQYRVVGVMKPGFHAPLNDDLWIPVTPVANPLNDNDKYSFIGVLLGDSMEESQRLTAEIQRLERELKSMHPLRVDTIKLEFTDVNKIFLNDELDKVVVLMFIMAILSLVAGAVCLAFLISFRNVKRAQEWYTRSILGYGSLDITRYVMIESFLIISVASLLSLLLYRLSINYIFEYAYINIAALRPYWWSLDPGVGVLFLVITFIGLVVVAVNLMPVFSQKLYVQKLMGVSQGKNKSNVGFRLGWVFLFLQVLTTLVLLFFIFSVLVSYFQISNEEEAFEEKNIYSFELQSPARSMSIGYGNIVRSVEYIYSNLEERESIFDVTISSKAPFSSEVTSYPFLIADRNNLDGGAESVNIKVVDVKHNFFDFFSIKSLRGRLFDEGDGAQSELVGIIDNKTAEYLFGNKKILGKKLLVGVGSQAFSVEIVGIVENVNWDLNPKSDDLLLFSPISQSQGFYAVFDPQFYIKSYSRNSDIADVVNNVVKTTDVNFGAGALKPMSKILRERGSGTMRLAINFFPAAILSVFMILLALVVLQTNLVRSYSKDISILKVIGMSEFMIIKKYMMGGIYITLLGGLAGVVVSVNVQRAFENAVYSAGDHRATAIIALAFVLVSFFSIICLYISTRKIVCGVDIAALIKQA